MASAIEDARRLPGETVCDQDGNRLGVVRHLYGVGEAEEPMWVTVEMSPSLGHTRLVFVPLARLKREREQIRVPYSAQHLLGSPEVQPGGELSEEDERALRGYYAIGLADQEVRSDNDSYAAQVPEAEGSARRLEV